MGPELTTHRGLEFHNTTATDVQLCVELANELRLRRIDLANPENHAVLIFESDTFYFAFCVCITSLIGSDFPNVPARGPAAFWGDSIQMLGAVVVCIFFNFWVADAADLARSFIFRLSGGRSYWPSGTQGPTTASEGSNDFDCMAETLDIQFLAGLTRTVGPLVYYPFIVLGLIITARAHDIPALKALIVPFTSAGLVNFVDLLTTK